MAWGAKNLPKRPTFSNWAKNVVFVDGLRYKKLEKVHFWVRTCKRNFLSPAPPPLSILATASYVSEMSKVLQKLKSYKKVKDNYIHVVILGSSIASPICQEGQSERIFQFFCLFFQIFSFYSILGKFFAVRGALCPPCSLDPWRWNIFPDKEKNIDCSSTDHNLHQECHKTSARRYKIKSTTGSVPCDRAWGSAWGSARLLLLQRVVVGSEQEVNQII